MANLTDALRGALSPESLSELNNAATRNSEASQIETKTSGACSPAVGLTLVSVTGTQAYTLAAGARAGQRKQFRVTVAASTPAGTLTPASFADGTSISLDAVNEYCELMWTGTQWRLVCIVGATVTP